MENIQYLKERPTDPRFLVSYETIKSDNSFDAVQRNAAFVYDNSVALIGLVAAGDLAHARTMADALLYAQANDRFFTDNRLRNAYQGGDIMLPPGWLPNNKPITVRMPGWYDATRSTWFEDVTQVSSNTGNIGWAILALLDFFEATNEQQYLQGAEQLGNWAIANTSDTRGAGGFTAGYDGWENGAASGSSFVCASNVIVNGQCKRLYKSTEHNIDMYAAFSRLNVDDPQDQWAQAASQAKAFVLSMWSADLQPAGHFWTGTEEDGVTVSEDVIPVDIQAWAIQALGADAQPYVGALNYVETRHKTALGYGFKQDGGNACGDNTWFEGTSQVAVAYLLAGNQQKWQSILNNVHSAQLPSGAIPATDGNDDTCVNTGFTLDNGQPWEYFHRAHVGATAWLSLAEHRVNPFGSNLYSPQPQVSLSAGQLNFGAQDVNSSAPPMTVKLTNSGNVPLSISGVSVTGDSAEFAIQPSSTCTQDAIVQPRAQCALNVVFTPASPGSKSAAIKVTDKALGSPHVIALFGTGEGFSDTALVSSLNPSTFGTAVTFTVTISSTGGVPGGTVTFKDGASTLGTVTLSGGKAAFKTSALAVGAHPIAAVYGGSIDFHGSSSPVLTQTVSQANSSTALVSSLNPSTFGTAVTFTATISSTGGVPSGTVTFKDGASTLGTVTLSGGKAALKTSALAVGAHPIAAVYGGSIDFHGSSSPVLTQTVSQANSSTALVSSLNPSTFGTAVTFTATISSTGGVPSGTVTFKDGASTLGTVTLSGGKAALKTSALAVGAHPIAAVYGGSIDFHGSSSPVLTQTVSQANSSTALVSSLNPSTFGTAVTFTATISSTGGVPSGTVTFKDGASTLGTVTLSGGKAAFKTSALAVGAHPIAAVYGGSIDFHGSSSPVLTQTVSQANSSTALVSSLNPSTFGTAVTFTVTISSTGGVPSGTVTFKDGASTLGTVTLSGGKAALKTSALAVGAHPIAAVYGGSIDFHGSSSPVLTQTVSQANSSTALVSSLNPSTFGTAVTFTVTISSTGGVPSGTVTFKDGASTLGTVTLSGGKAALKTSALAVGAHPIAAVYGGSIDFHGSSSPVLTQTVSQANSSTALVSSLNPSTFGTAVTFTVTISSTGGVPSGTVTFKDGASTLGTVTLSGGKAAFKTSALAVGAHPIAAVYGGSIDFHGSSSPVLTQTVSQANSSTALVSSLNPSTFGTAVTFTATISSTGGVPSGTVTFKDGASTLGTVTLSGGKAALKTSALAVGAHPIAAVYGGSIDFHGSSSPVLTQTVSQANSSTALVSSLNPSTFGTAVTFTATISSTGGVPSGTVTFKDGASTLGTVTLSGGKAAFKTSTLAVGAHPIAAVYGGSIDFHGSSSPVLTQTVQQVPVTLRFAPIPPVTLSALGQKITPIDLSTYRKGGVAPFTYSLVSQSAPDTVNCSLNGSILGSDYAFRGGVNKVIVEVTDSQQKSAQMPVTVSVSVPVVAAPVYGIDFGPFENGQDPNTGIMLTHILLITIRI